MTNTKYKPFKEWVLTQVTITKSKFLLIFSEDGSSNRNFAFIEPVMYNKLNKEERKEFLKGYYTELIKPENQ